MTYRNTFNQKMLLIYPTVESKKAYADNVIDQFKSNIRKLI